MVKKKNLKQETPKALSPKNYKNAMFRYKAMFFVHIVHKAVGPPTAPSGQRQEHQMFSPLQGK